MRSVNQIKIRKRVPGGSFISRCRDVGDIGLKLGRN